ncbi:MAG TPA: hypothetical protein VMF09_16570 [Solirubrobacteraceae bacterium]|nr:hypothetical protein [Solirubrobacteraceae bacterium]
MPALAAAPAGTPSATRPQNGSAAPASNGKDAQVASGSPSGSPALLAAYPVVYCVFDLLALDGGDLTGRPLRERRARLR